MTFEEIKETADYLKNKTGFKPTTGIILGTGLGALVNDVDIETGVPYEEIPHFPVSTVEGHKGRLIFGYLSGVPVVIMQGRFHYYEGYSMQQITFPVRVMKLLGIKNLLISNAAGAINQTYEISDLMILKDHINLLPENPLRGANLDQLGPRFPDMSNPYEKNFIAKALDICKEHQIPVHSGVYTVIQGPNLETEAEYNYMSVIGADAVGMSTVPENIVSKHMGIPCFAVSVITDKWIPGHLEEVTIEKVLSAAAVAEPRLTLLIKNLISKI